MHRIEQLLLDAGVPKRQVRRELADACKISSQAVGDWFNGKTKKISPDYLATIASKWGTTSDYLITGKHPPALHVGEKSAVYNAGQREYQVPEANPAIPLISMDMAADWQSISIFDSGEKIDFYPSPVACSPNSFILELIDSSMDDGSPGAYHQGEWVYIDPEQTANTGDDVIANIEGKAVFGRLSGQATSLILESVNPRWPNGIRELGESPDIIGKVIFSGKKR